MPAVIENGSTVARLEGAKQDMLSLNFGFSANYDYAAAINVLTTGHGRGGDGASRLIKLKFAVL
ncbi:MAG: hypothetical protein GY874_08200 [Desulfobacteraceae bacterium]|nr:hypothetical protein [Desulfobacteraceae bacterium]